MQARPARWNFGPPTAEAVGQGHAAVVRALLDAGAALDGRGSTLSGGGLLHLASSRGDVVTRHGRLTSLHLDGTGVGAAAVEALVRPGRLESLSLGGAEITEEDTLRIARAHSGLRYLQPPEGWRADSWDRLREALPRLHGPGCGFQFCGNDVAIERARRTRTDETTPLMDAVVRREHARLASLLRHGADPNEHSPSDMVTGAAATDLLTESDVYPPVTPLHAACALGDEVAVDRLLGAGADPTLGLDDGRRPIDAAAERGAASIVRRLLAAGATPSAGDGGGSSGVLGALENGHIDVARVLMEAGHEPPLNAVFLAVRNALGQRRLEQAAEILAVGNVDLEDLDPERTRSLFSAASIDPRPRAVELLLAAGADPNVGDSRAMTPLHDAASRGRVEVARLLLAAGADRHARNSAGWTAAMFARRAGAEALAAALETDGETIADRRRAELFRALDKNDVAELEALLKAGADPNGRGPGYDNGKDLLGRPILLHAIADQRLGCAVALIDAGADVDATDEFGRNALWFARQFADDRVVEALLNAGATEEGT